MVSEGIGSNSYRVPWLSGEEAVQVLRHFTKIKEKLRSYLVEQAKTCHETGIPVMRSMVLEFPEDSNCFYPDRRYLPAGNWRNYFTIPFYERL